MESTVQLYHYTDVNGLMGIIKYEKLWATDINFLNDSEEYYAGIRKLKDFCSSSLSSLDKTNHVDKVISGLYELIPDIIEKNLTNRNLYITSFTSKEDNLRQWMSYCPDNSGYCIEFDRHNILMNEQCEKKLNITCRIEDVDYGQGTFDKQLSFESIMKMIKATDTRTAALNVANNLLFHCCAIKNNEFHDESETRLVAQSTISKEHNAKYRTRSGVIVPYIEYPIKKSAIKRIIIGPNINMDLAKKGLEDFLIKNEITCKVETSKCSLRSL